MLNSKQIATASKIDARTRELELAGANEVEIFVGMEDLMPGFKYLMDTAAHGGLDELCARFSAFLGLRPRNDTFYSNAT